MTTPVPNATRSTRAVDVNQRFYDALWATGSLTPPQRFNTWPLLSALADAAAARLEIGPGLRPRLPMSGTCFADVSAPALVQVRAHQGYATRAEITALPFPDSAFDLVCAFDIVEHVEDDRQVFREITRVARDGAAIVFSVPLQPRRWSNFDALVGHVRRYEVRIAIGIIVAVALVLYLMRRRRVGEEVVDALERERRSR